MSFLGALFKPFKKIIKKIGKGIKKVVKKIGKVVNKLGIVGQLGMMFLMPYAMGALGSFLGNIGGAVVGKLGEWGTSLLARSGVGSQALGHTLTAISNVGTSVGTAYTNVTSAISNAFDTVVNKAKEVTGIGTPTSYQQVSPGDPLSKMPPASGPIVDPTAVTAPSPHLPSAAPEISVGDMQKDFIADQAKKSTVESVADMSIQIPGFETPTIAEPQSILARITEYGKDKAIEIGTDIKDKVVADAKDLINQPIEMLKEQAAAKTKQALYAAVGMAPDPTQVNNPDVGSSFNTAGVYAATQDSVSPDLINHFASVGNNYTPYSIANRDYTNNFLNSFNPQNNYSAADAYTGYYMAPNVNTQLGGLS